MNPSKTILVVEDEVALNQALIDTLLRSGYKAIGVMNGEKGLNLAYNSRPDLIILDAMMPVMGGLEMLKLLRQDKWGSTVPVILLTNVNNFEQAPALKTDPNIELLIKSDTGLEELLQHIRRRLEDLT